MSAHRHFESILEYIASALVLSIINYLGASASRIFTATVLQYPHTSHFTFYSKLSTYVLEYCTRVAGRNYECSGTTLVNEISLKFSFAI